jgi:hypothetical protein
MDPACGMVSCEALSTECRRYRAAPMACAGFARCGSSADVSTCRDYNAINEGAACASPGCSTKGVCQMGDCVCPDPPAGVSGPRALPPGCSMGGHARGSLTGVLVLLGLLGLRRRLLGALLALLALLAACNDPSVLQVDLALDDATLSETASVRIVIRSQDAAGFRPTPIDNARADERIRNFDVDRDGRAEIVADLLPEFPFGRSVTYLKVAPSNKSERAVSLAAQVIDRYGNPIASVEGASSVLPGGGLTLTASCGSRCGTALEHALDNPITVDVGGHAVWSLATHASGITAVGIPDAGPATRPARGHLVLLRPDEQRNKLQPFVTLVGENSGDRLGEALALGDVDGDGELDLIAGAPGARNELGETSGRVFVVYGPLGGLSGELPLIHGMLAAPTSTIQAEAAQLIGSSLALLRSDDGKHQDVIAGAPGEAAGGSIDRSAGAVYAARMVARGAALSARDLPQVRGAATGAHLGRSVAASAAWFAAGAPGENAVYVIDPRTELTSGGVIPARIYRDADGRGGLGAQVALFDVDGNGQPRLAASAPGRDAVDVLDVEATPSVSNVLSGIPGSDTGARLTGFSSGFGDLLAVTSDAASGGSVVRLVAPGALLAAGRHLPLADDSRRTALTVTLAAARVTAASGGRVLSGADAPGLELLFGDSAGKLYVFSTGGAP